MNFTNLPRFERLTYGSDGTYNGIVMYTLVDGINIREISVAVTYSETTLVQNNKYVYKTACQLSPETVILLITRLL